MADKAAQLGETLLSLLTGKGKRLPRSAWETNYTIGSISESPNKQSVSNACELVWALDEGHPEIADAVLDWFEWLDSQPFMPKETNTGDDVYKELTAYPTMVAAGVANQLQRGIVAEACLRLARAHAAWCLVGLGPVAGKLVVDHHLDAIREPCVLVGKKSPRYPIRRVASAGPRGWVRNRANGQPKTFIWLDHLVHSLIVYQALNWDIPRKVRNQCKWGVDMLAAIRDRWQSLPVWGFDSVDVLILRNFAENPANPDNARELIEFLKPTALPVQFVRYADTSVVSVLLRSEPSSTDALMLDCNYASGEVQMTSCDDGLRQQAIRQVAFEESGALACRAANGSGPTMRIPKPRSERAHSIISIDGHTLIEGEDGTPPPVPPTPTGSQPPPASEPCPWYKKILGVCK